MIYRWPVILQDGAEGIAENAILDVTRHCRDRHRERDLSTIELMDAIEDPGVGGRILDLPNGRKFYLVCEVSGGSWAMRVVVEEGVITLYALTGIVGDWRHKERTERVPVVIRPRPRAA